MSVKYTEDHEWIKVDGDIGTVGISAYAAKQLWMKQNTKSIVKACRG